MLYMLRITLLATAISFSSSVWAQEFSGKYADSLVQRVLTTFDVPGIAVAVIHNDSIIHLKGYGVRSLKTQSPVDANTLFGIASNSKAFTSAALAMLVDEGKIQWDDRVTDYLPAFKMYDPYVTAHFTIRDLLTHRSGLGLGAGDLMMFPDSNNFTRKDILHNLRYLKPVSDYRTKFDYDNNLYIVAGEVIAAVSGMSWEDFIETRIMRPLGMKNSAASFYRIGQQPNVAMPHAPVNGKINQIEIGWSETANAAGGIYSSVNELSEWVRMQLRGGSFGTPSRQLFSKEQQQEMWTPQTILPTGTSAPYYTHFASYGLGWFLSDIKGYKQCMHTGGLAGMVTQVTLIPELKLGIIVLTNQQSGAAFTAITNSIKDRFLGISGYDRVKMGAARVQQQQSEADSITRNIWKQVRPHSSEGHAADSSRYCRNYTDAWFGDVSVYSKNGRLHFKSSRSLKLHGLLHYYKGNTFVAEWPDRSMDADAFVQFRLDAEGKAEGFTMKAISPMTDFSFDFQDLDFKSASAH